MGYWWSCVFLIFLVTDSVLSQSTDEIIMNAMTSSLDTDSNVNAEDEVQVELDMVFKREDWKEISELPKIEVKNNGQTRQRHKRKAIRDMTKRWTNGVIPYTIDDNIGPHHKRRILNATRDWEMYTCLNFRPANSTDVNSIHIYNNSGEGCKTDGVGMIGGQQNISLANHCFQHELGHVIGFYHEHSRHDRDRYVTIQTQNIEPGRESDFAKNPTNMQNDYGVPYDYTSIMHYGQYFASANGQPTIRTQDPSKQDVIGHPHGLSFRDITLANLMYKCADRCSTNITCPGEGVVGKDCKCWCPGNPIRECCGGSGGDGHRACCWRYVVTPNSKSKGAGILMSQGGTVYDCQDSCSNDSDCTALDFNNEQQRTKCWIHKNHTYPQTVLSMPLGIESHYDKHLICGECTYAYYPHKSRTGGTIQSFTSEENCITGCSADPSCVAVQYRHDSVCTFFCIKAVPTIHDTEINYYDQTFCEGSCTWKYIVTSNSHSHGGTLVSRGGTVHECQDSCSSDPECTALDFHKNPQRTECWLHKKHTYPQTVPSSLGADMHYDKYRMCGGCTYAYYPKKRSRNGGAIRNLTSEEHCITGCSADPNCVAVQYNIHDSVCMFFTMEAVPTIDDSGINYYARTCCLPSDDVIVVFDAVRHTDFGPASESIIIPFDVVTLNVREAYNPATGIFTVPVTGLYEISWSVQSKDSAWSHLLVDEKLEGQIGSRFHVTASGTRILNLKLGDKVKTTLYSFGGINGTLWCTQSRACAFNGHLLHVSCDLHSSLSDD